MSGLQTAIALFAVLLVAGCSASPRPDSSISDSHSSSFPPTSISETPSNGPPSNGPPSSTNSSSAQSGPARVELANGSRAWGLVSNGGGWLPAFTTNASLQNLTIYASVLTSDSGTYYVGGGISGSGNAGMNFAPKDDNLNPMGYIPFTTAQGNANAPSELERKEKTIRTPPASDWVFNLFGTGQNVEVHYVVTAEILGDA